MRVVEKANGLMYHRFIKNRVRATCVILGCNGICSYEVRAFRGCVFNVKRVYATARREIRRSRVGFTICTIFLRFARDVINFRILFTIDMFLGRFPFIRLSMFLCSFILLASGVEQCFLLKGAQRVSYVAHASRATLALLSSGSSFKLIVSTTVVDVYSVSSSCQG